MGCDVHMYTERLAVINGKEGWHNCDNWRLNAYHNEYPQDEQKWEVRPLYRDRDYNLFAVLADIRNYGEDKPICVPRGLPNDVSDAIKAESDRWDSDGHSHSYFTLTELRAHKLLNNVTRHAGLVNPENAAKVDKGEMPDSWCQGTSQEDYVRKAWEQEGSPLTGLITLLDERMRDIFWVWNDEERPELDEKIRIVFWFDN